MGKCGHSDLVNNRKTETWGARRYGGAFFCRIPLKLPHFLVMPSRFRRAAHGASVGALGVSTPLALTAMPPRVSQGLSGNIPAHFEPDEDLLAGEGRPDHLDRFHTFWLALPAAAVYLADLVLSGLPGRQVEGLSAPALPPFLTFHKRQRELTTRYFSS